VGQGANNAGERTTPVTEPCWRADGDAERTMTPTTEEADDR